MAPPEVPRLRVLMVCMGNICRSPTAEGVLRARLQLAGLDRLVEVDSAGTHAYHVGDPPDPRSVKHARRRGVDLSMLRARRVLESDFLRFDHIYAMDHGNLADLERIRPLAIQARVALLMSTVSPTLVDAEVPDPYGGGAADFDRVLDLVEQAADAIVVELTANRFKAQGNFPS